ncbi:MAG: cell envelope integrity protein TolA [Gammaproteobacteria bacterium]|nr:cell envelope integrity protein TolA [Gammaproteobacteria bacterium]
MSITLSVLLHGALLAALVYGWLVFRRPPQPAPTLAIEATVVDARAVRGAPTPPAPAPRPVEPPPPPPQEVGPPPPTPEELAKREAERKQAREAAEEQRRAVEELRRAAEEKAAAERAAAAEREKRAAVERQREADARERNEQEAELKRSLAAEERASAARSGPAVANWEALIAAKITRAWLRPPTARPGIQCMLYVTQVPGGEVTQVRIGDCNGDQAVRESIEAAVYRASPLPPPPDPALFDRNLKIEFKPD